MLEIPIIHSLNFYVQLLKFVIPHFTYGLLTQVTRIFLFIKPQNLLRTVNFLSKSSVIQGVALVDIIVVDNITATHGRFSVTYCIWSYSNSFRLCLRLFVNNYGIINSLSQIYKGANWLEREAWDMFGIKFVNHPDLRRILTDYGFSGHPLRKDFPLTGFVEIRYDDTYRHILYEPLELTQDLRFFKFDLVWKKNTI